MQIKGVLLSNMKDLSNQSYLERYVYTYHVQDTISIYGPVLSRWFISRSETSSMPEEYDLDRYGAYNWTMVELHFTENPYGTSTGGGNRGGAALAEYFHKDHRQRLGFGDAPRKPGWNGSSEFRANAMTHIPLRPTEDFWGNGITLQDGPFFRWIQMIRIPDGVSEEEFDDWYINIHAKEACQFPGLKRFISFKRIEGLPSMFYRVSELWFSDPEAWKYAVDHGPEFTRPAWATNKEYPFVEPFKEFVSSFVLERPTYDLLHKSAYVFST